MGAVEKTPLLRPSTRGSNFEASEKIYGWKKGGAASTRKAAGKASGQLRQQESPPTISLHRKEVKPTFAGTIKKKAEAVSKKILGKQIQQKAKQVLNIGTEVVTHKTALLGVVYYKLQSLVQIGKGGPGTFTALHRIGATIGALSILSSLTGIGTAIGKCCSQIKELRKSGQATPKNVLKAIAKSTIIEKPLITDLTNLSYGAVLLTFSAASLRHKLSAAVMTSLGIASKALGGAAGALTALYGILKTGLGIKDSIVSAKKLHLAKKALQNFEAAYPTPLTAVQQLKKLRLETAVKQANKELAQSILKACLGTFVTVGGALSIAASFTMGTTSLGLIIAGLVVGVAASAVQIANYVYQKKSQKRLDKEFHEVLTSYPLEGKEWESLAKELNLNPNLAKEKREKALKDYCFFKTPPQKPLQPSEPTESGIVQTSTA